MNSNAKKLAAKNDKINKLEDKLAESKDKQQNLLNIIKKLKEEFATLKKKVADGEITRERGISFLPPMAIAKQLPGRRTTIMGGVKGLTKASIS